MYQASLASACGAHDAYSLWEAPNNVAMAATAISISAGGALSSFQTTPLLTVEETLAVRLQRELARHIDRAVMHSGMPRFRPRSARTWTKDPAKTRICSPPRWRRSSASCAISSRGPTIAHRTPFLAGPGTRCASNSCAGPDPAAILSVTWTGLTFSPASSAPSWESLAAVSVAREHGLFSDLDRSSFERLLPELATLLSALDLRTVVDAYMTHAGYRQLASRADLPAEVRLGALGAFVGAHQQALDTLRACAFTKAEMRGMQDRKSVGATGSTASHSATQVKP